MPTLLRGLLFRCVEPGWAKEAFKALLPGGHAAVSGGFQVPIEAEDVGFEVRDCIVCLGMPSRRIWLLRKPLQEGTVAGQMLATGTGALNIDACRVGWDAKSLALDTLRCQTPRTDITSGSFTCGKPAGYIGEAKSPQGRWPPNLVFVHGPECRDVGTKRVPGHAAFGSPKDSKGGILNKTEQSMANPHPGYADKDGLETTQAWACQPGCPVAVMDQQSGTLASGSVASHHQRNNSSQPSRGGYGGGFGDTPLMGYGDQGGASRFFPQFRDGAELDVWLAKLTLPAT